MKHGYNTFTFPETRAVPSGRRTGWVVSKYAGMPPAVEFADRWYSRVWCLGDTTDQEAFVDSPASPTETSNGSEWIQTQLNSSTITVVDTGFPPYMRIATGATEGDGQSMQAAIGATGNTRTIFDTSTMADLFFSATVRLSDANNNAATVEQCQLFLGFAPVDTTIFTSVDDFIGFTKADGSGVLRIAADQTTVAPGSASTISSLISLSPTTGANLVNKWFTVTFRASGLGRTAQVGTVYAHLDYNRTPSGATENSPTHYATLDLSVNDDVPGAAMCPTIAFRTGEAVAKRLDIAKLVVAGKYRLNV